MKNYVLLIFSTILALSPALHAQTQLPDTSESAISLSRLINRQLAARGTEYRSMNEFDPNQNEKTIQSWVRAYAGSADRDASAGVSGYDSDNLGALIGIDKRFGNLLVGLAGGYARADLESDSYDTNIDTFYGSLYSTAGGDNLFIDLALTYGATDTKESNSTLEEDAAFDSDLLCLYAGSGWRFEIADKILLTPDASLLLTYYGQNAYARSTGMIAEYDTTSLQGAIGINASTVHQVDWLSQGLAFIPELRLHYIHEFQTDQDDFTFTTGGSTDSYAVRPLVENMAHIGIGFDVWNWNYQNTKFEVDYDGLFASDYSEQILSGKITVRF